MGGLGITSRTLKKLHHQWSASPVTFQAGLSSSNGELQRTECTNVSAEGRGSEEEEEEAADLSWVLAAKRKSREQSPG